MAEQRGAPPGIDVTTPSVARMYDYYLGGKDNFAADREAAEEVLKAAPDARPLLQANRAFLGRAVRYLVAEAGIRQFIDLGTGLPTQENVHQVAQRITPDARVVYVDNDPIVLAHGRALLVENDTTTVIQADMRDPEAILAHPETRQLIDPAQPVAVLFVSVLHFIDDADDPAGIVARLRAAMTPGSYLVLTHGTWGERAEATSAAADVYQRATSQVTLRTDKEIAALFGGFQLVEPGLVDVAEWRPDGSTRRDLVADSRILAGVGRKP